MKIGIYGGAFNPVHTEHVNIALSAKRELSLDKVLVIPSFISPHKSGVLTARPRERAEMCRLAFAGQDGVEVSDCEIKRGGVSYSYITCRRLRKQYPDDELYFIIGADSLKGFPTWREPEEILKCVTLAVCAREEKNSLVPLIREFNARYKRDIVSFRYVGGSVSSTAVRALTALDVDAGEMLCPPVRKYIAEHNLYALPEIDCYKKYLSAERFAHTVRVALFAAEHCGRCGVYEFDALIAAALHDVAKDAGGCAEELAGFICPPNVPPPVIHQYAGAYMAEHTFGIKDENILNAVRYHTSGRENMSALEKLIYLADLLESGRSFDGVDKLRREFAKGLDAGMRAALAHNIKYLEERGARIYPLTRRALDYLTNIG